MAWNGNIKIEGYYNEGECFIEKEFDEKGVLIDFKTITFNNETLRESVKEWLEDDKAAAAKYGHISSWDTSEVTDMGGLFLFAYDFNEPIGDWDVGKVTNMSCLFAGYEDDVEVFAFNHPLNKWDVTADLTREVRAAGWKGSGRVSL